MLLHSFDRFYVVTKFISPTTDDIKISEIAIDVECNYLSFQLDKGTHAVKYLHNIRNFCSKTVPFIYYYKKQVESYEQTIYNILTKEIPLITLAFIKN